ncbi:hypothetical protein SAMN04487995_2070 [Dyadobacter koreensis]|uniref:CcmD family protein n=1 Tax=Dyadobacter koreensis TaxID=408657 RepID=A0A1H6TIL4_9BACT|nr:CcmD family protein [Dyadobacter koreensis]SEI76055.1 hypothetical protein SAMN04487995_2070 [Dyadobacter koreensis]
MKKIILLLLTLVSLPQLLFAQAADQVEMADKLRADGKIWVVVAVVAIVLAGIAINMFRVDSKVSKIEKELNIK